MMIAYHSIVGGLKRYAQWNIMKWNIMLNVSRY